MIYDTLEILDTLPAKPSELLRISLKIFKEAVQNPDIVIDMENWFLKVNEDIYGCHVCLAGAVIRHLLLLNNKNDVNVCDPFDFTASIKYKLLAINRFRDNCPNQAFNYLEDAYNIKRDTCINCAAEIRENCFVPGWAHQDNLRKEWFMELKKVILILEKHNL